MKTNSHELLVHALTAWRTMRLLGYLDPGSGSYVFQMLIAGLTGVLFFFTSIKRKILSLFHKGGPEHGIAGAAPMKAPPARESKDKSVVR